MARQNNVVAPNGRVQLVAAPSFATKNFTAVPPQLVAAVAKVNQMPQIKAIGGVEIADDSKAKMWDGKIVVDVSQNQQY